MERSAATLIRTFVTLRWLAIIGQSLTVSVVILGFGLQLPAAWLWGGIASLGLFNLVAQRRLARRDTTSRGEALGHIAFDVAVLAWLIGWSGGIANPFTSLFLLPIAFAAPVMPARWIYAVALVCCVGYAGSILFGQPLPHLHGPMSGFDLHLLGMAVNFIVSATVLLYFFVRMSAQLREREHELSGLRERFARNEGIVALATHAASVAHELNTPLATMTLMIDDLIEDDADQTLRDDYRILRKLLDVCRDRVRELASPAGTEGGAGSLARVELNRVIDRWQVVRPAIALIRHGAIATIRWSTQRSAISCKPCSTTPRMRAKPRVSPKSISHSRTMTVSCMVKSATTVAVSVAPNHSCPRVCSTATRPTASESDWLCPTPRSSA
jgi:two-component system sensor histidine kinase RegB